MKIIAVTKYKYHLIMSITCLMMFFTKCISPFEPDIQGKSGLLVVDGSIIKGRETQVIIISKTSPISQPEYLPVENCSVRIIDNVGNEFVFDEESPGKYVANIDDALLNYDNQYKLFFTTSSGTGYESNYQKLLESYPVDSLYGIPENHYSSVTGQESDMGIQFYVDLDAPENASRHYRWVVEETWEKHARNEDIWGVYDGLSIKQFPRRDSLYRCWETKNVTGLYSATTVNLSENRLKRVPLHFVEANSQKLVYKYCATIRQYALNEDAYDYWYEKERELNESGNIYTIQPSQPKSNIFNINNPEEQVMGFFWVGSTAVKRVFVRIPSVPVDEGMCEYIGVYCESNNFNEIADRLYSAFAAFANDLPYPPYYITVEYNTNYLIVKTPRCVDCRVLGGDTRKPDFWE